MKIRVPGYGTGSEGNSHKDCLDHLLPNVFLWVSPNL